jgi:hypothetical protein
MAPIWGLPDDPSGRVAFSDIIVKDGEHEISSLLAEKNTSKSLTCETKVSLDIIRGLFTRQPTRREFVLELVSQDGSHKYTAPFHFDLSEVVLEQLVDPQGSGSIRLVDSIK